jgi:hypothetical protein
MSWACCESGWWKISKNVNGRHERRRENKRKMEINVDRRCRIRIGEYCFEKMKIMSLGQKRLEGKVRLKGCRAKEE